MKPALSRERLVAAALTLIDASGLEALSMRKLGAALGVEGMAIYYYFPAKDRLLDAVAERLLDELEMDARLEGDWIAWARATAHSYRAIAMRHPNAFPLLAMRRYTGLDGFRRLEVFFRVMAKAGFDAAMTARVFRILGYFINGAGLADIATAAALNQDQRRTALDGGIDVAAWPEVAKVAPHLAQGQLDAIFDFGLEMLLRGLEQARP